MKRFLKPLLAGLLLMIVLFCAFWAGDGLLSAFRSDSVIWSNTPSREEPKNEEKTVQSGLSPVSPPKRVGVQVGAASQEYERVVSKRARGTAHYPYLNQNLSYDALNEEQRECYEKLLTSVYRLAGEKNTNGHYGTKPVLLRGSDMSEADIRKTVSAFRTDHPEVFWLANVFGYAKSGGDTYIELYSQLSADECQLAIDKLNAAVDEAVSKLQSGMTEFERELSLHDWLCERVSYDTAAAEGMDEWQAFTAYGALVEKSAVCEGYARSMQLLLSYANIACTLTSGSSRESLHMWNAVCIDGEWYYLDATWNDADTMINYHYFNVTEETLKADHDIDPAFSSLSTEEICGTEGGAPTLYNLVVPDCTHTTANYYRVKAVTISTLDAQSDSTVISRLKACAKSRERSISLKFENDADYDGIIDKMFLDAPYKFLYYIEKANQGLPDELKFDSGSVLFSEDKTQKAVTVKLSYLSGQ